MYEVFLYFVKSVVSAGILYGYYYFALRNEKFHSYNRFYLLATLVLSSVIPFVHFNFFQIDPAGARPIGEIWLWVNHGGDAGQKGISSHAVIWLRVGVSLIGLFMAGLLASKIAWIYRIKKGGIVREMKGFTFIETDAKQAPFSFLRNLFWKRGLDPESENGRKIFVHELTHIRQGHTIDKLFCQVLACLCWFNPFFWIILKELETIHEFIADATAVSDGDAEGFASMLLETHNDGRYLNASHSFYYSSIKRRLNMIAISRNSRYSYLKRMLPLPVTVCLVTLMSFQLKAQVDPKLKPDSIKVNHITVSNPRADNGNGDSIEEVHLDYIGMDNKPAKVYLVGVKYKTAPHHPSEGRVFVKLSDGGPGEITTTTYDVSNWVKNIIRNPPDVMYYLDGEEVSVDIIKKLDPGTVKAANILRGKEAAQKYGAKAEGGIILFTTK